MSATTGCRVCWGTRYVPVYGRLPWGPLRWVLCKCVSALDEQQKPT